MLKIVSLVSLVAMALLLNSCTGSKVLLSTHYNGKRINRGDLVIQIIDKKPGIGYSGKLQPEFGEGTTEDLILKYFQKRLIHDIKNNTSFKNVKVLNNDTNVRYNKLTLDYWEKSSFFFEKNRIGVKVPETGSVYTFEGSKSGYILVIDNLGIGTYLMERPTTVGSNGIVVGGGKSKHFNYMCNFSIWDNIKKQLVSYGHVERSEQIFFQDIKIGTWKRVSDSFVKAIFKKSPFFSSPAN